MNLSHSEGNFLFKIVRIQFVRVMGHNVDESLDEFCGGIIQQEEVLAIHPEHIRVSPSQMQAKPGNRHVPNFGIDHFVSPLYIKQTQYEVYYPDINPVTLEGLVLFYRRWCDVFPTKIEQ
jgi:hypothetical protein